MIWYWDCEGCAIGGIWLHGDIAVVRYVIRAVTSPPDEVKYRAGYVLCRLVVL